MTYKAGQLVRCVKRGPWVGPLGDVGPRYDDRLVVTATKYFGRRVIRLGLKFSDHRFAYDAKYFRPVVFTSSKQTAETKEPVT